MHGPESEVLYLNGLCNMSEVFFQGTMTPSLFPLLFFKV